MAMPAAATPIAAPLTEQLPESTPTAPPAGLRPVPERLAPGHVLLLGEYLVGETPDPRLSGHPCIRY